MLSITLGPMCAGKTSSMINTYRSCVGKKIIIDFDIDNNTKCFWGHVNTHDNVKEESIKATKLFDTLDIYNVNGNFQMAAEYFHEYKYTDAPELYKMHDTVKFSEHIFINEAQFFPDLYEFVTKYSNKNIYLYGLDGDFKREKIGRIIDLIPLCDSVIKLNSICVCGKNAIFTHRDSLETEQYVPNATYTPLCRACYLKKINKMD
jgi:thymidine kinase